MDIAISPAVLEFSSPFTGPSTKYITITNNSAETVAFKVKTTAPKLYCVRPNAATIAAGESVEVSIILLGLKEEPPIDFKCNDKFLIVALPFPYDLGDNTVGGLWPKLEAEFKPQSKSQKIKVKYNIAADPINEEDAATGVSSGVAAGSVGNTKVSDIADKDIDEVSQEDRSKIDALNEKLDSNVAGSAVSEKKTSAVKQQATQNSSLPIPTIILLAIIAFIIAWLFL
ncbi:CYFA0S01e17546g1_1 [Cyberlindnera fabianii]|uniref:CYFA0S01e17546g1_1 n=1 Tax=Cyberlindnera fabianii TaxID=36022 RepID=A0A061AR02_CYBFA|nr:CYFA0S01e17546g1_1 [Cyberlindnera fabianii]